MILRHCTSIRRALRCFFILLFSSTSAAMAADEAQDLVINEIMAANLGEAIDPSWNFGGWIEIYNPTTRNISLDGLTVADAKGHAFKLTSKHGSISAGKFKCLWFDHNDKNFPTQIDFKLDCDGGTIALLRGDAVVNSVTYPEAISRTSWARTTDGASQWNFCAWPTPEASNDGATFASEQLPAPVPSTDGGWIDGTTTFSVTIAPDANLYYTTDGSVPTLSSPMATLDADGTAHFTVDKNTVYRFRAIAPPSGGDWGVSLLPSPVVTRSFITRSFTKTITIDPWGGGGGWGGWDPWGGGGGWGGWEDTTQETTTFGSFSLLSLVTDDRYLYDNQMGIYVDGTNGGYSYWGYANYYQDWDRPVNVEIFEAESVPSSLIASPASAAGSREAGSLLINQEVDMTMSGGYSRMSDPKSFKLKSSKKYDGHNYYPLCGIFDEKRYARYKDLLVRVGGTDMVNRHQDNALQAVIRRSGLYVDTQAFRPVYVFFNGEYIETLLLREPSNKQYGASNYGLDTDLMDTLEESDITGVTLASGNWDAFGQLYDAAAEAATNDAQWQRVQELLDIDEYINYFALELYLANQDWPQNNIKMFRERSENDADGTGSPFHVVVQDLDACFHESGNTFDRIDQYEYYPYATAGRQENILLTLFFHLMQREEFRKQFVDAFCLVAGSVFDPENVKADFDRLSEELTPGYIEQRSSLTSALNTLRNQLSSTWQKQRINYLTRWGKAKLSSARSITATITAPHGALINHLPIPRGHFDGTLFLPVTLQAGDIVGQDFAGWSLDGTIVSTDRTLAITQGGNYEAVYRTTDTPSLQPPVVVNEVSADNTIYQSPRLKRSDWIELYNTTDAPIDIAGFYISDDPADPYKYQLPILSPPSEGPGEVLIPAHGHLVLWANDVQLPFRLANADYNAVMISSPDGQWSDVFYYHAMNGRQSVGRWPDGGRDVYRFDRPTIESANLYTSHAELLTFDPVIVGVATPLAPPPSYLLPSNSSLPLYDLQGRRTHHASPIVISRGKKIITE